MGIKKLNAGKRGEKYVFTHDFSYNGYKTNFLEENGLILESENYDIIMPYSFVMAAYQNQEVIWQNKHFYRLPDYASTSKLEVLLQEEVESFEQKNIFVLQRDQKIITIPKCNIYSRYNRNNESIVSFMD